MDFFNEILYVKQDECHGNLTDNATLKYQTLSFSQNDELKEIQKLKRRKSNGHWTSKHFLFPNTARTVRANETERKSQTDVLTK